MTKADSWYKHQCHCLQSDMFHLLEENRRMSGVLIELRHEYEGAGKSDEVRSQTYRWSLTRINYALDGQQDES